jgi:hypothetical protein
VGIIGNNDVLLNPDYALGIVMRVESLIKQTFF